MYCVTKAEFFFGFELPKDEDGYSKYDDWDENEKLEDFLMKHPYFMLVHAMMGSESSRYFIAVKDSYYCSDDMEVVDGFGTFGEQYYEGPVWGMRLYKFMKKHFTDIEYTKKTIGWKLVSSGWSST